MLPECAFNLSTCLPRVIQEQRGQLLDRGPALEALVESYTGARHLSAAQQREGLLAIVNNLPDSAGPAAKAFAHRSLATLQVRVEGRRRGRPEMGTNSIPLRLTWVGADKP